MKLLPSRWWRIAAQRKELYDESHRRMDEWLDGRRDVVLADDRRPVGLPVGRRYYQAIQKIIQHAVLPRNELLTMKGHLC